MGKLEKVHFMFSFIRNLILFYIKIGFFLFFYFTLTTYDETVFFFMGVFVLSLKKIKYLIFFIGVY